MADGEPRDEQEVDDWFDEPDVSGAWEERSARLARSRQPDAGRREQIEDWTSDAAVASRREPLPLQRLLNLRTALVAGLLVVLLLGGLAAAGVFSSGARPVAPLTTSTPTAPTTTATTAATQTRPALVAPTAPLKPGDQGAAVKRLQRVLARLGYSPGTIDGQYGPSTTKAVSKFQSASGLTADGVVGSKTLLALDRALATG